MTNRPIDFPGQFAPGVALSFAGPDDLSRTVSASNRLPVEARPALLSTPLAGTASTSTVVGPFALTAGRMAMVSLSGAWTGQITVLRSADNGVTRLPLTVGGLAWGIYTANCCEAVWEEGEDGAQLYLDIQLASGSVTYRVAQ